MHKTSRRHYFFPVIIFALFAWSAADIFADAGDLDTTFGTGGMVIDNALDMVEDTAIQADGKFVVVGLRKYCPLLVCIGPLADAPALARYNSDGTPDLSFGINGRVVKTGGSGRYSSVVIQSNGRIVAVGSRDDDYIADRYYANGTDDPTFNAAIPFSPQDLPYGGWFGIALEPGTSKLIVGGTVSGLTALGSFKVSRLNSSGSLDTSFANRGTQYIQGWGVLQDLTIDGWTTKIALATNSGVSLTVCLLNSNGSLDTNFGCSTANFNNHLHSTTGVAFQRWVYPVGPFPAVVTRIVATGNVQDPVNFEQRFALARFKMDGALDTSFNGDGKMLITFGSQSAHPRELRTSSDGKIVIAGTFLGQFALARVTREGNLDTSFGGDGMVTTAIFSGSDPLFGDPGGMVFQSDAKIVVAGKAWPDANSAQTSVALARYEP